MLLPRPYVGRHILLILTEPGHEVGADMVEEAPDAVAVLDVLV